MSIEALKLELSALDTDGQRHMTAFLISLQTGRDKAYQKKLAKKINQPASKFATLEVLDQRLGISSRSKRS